MVANNGANMIGIHAVYIDTNSYLSSEEKYFPFKRNLEINENLPLSFLKLIVLEICKIVFRII